MLNEIATGTTVGLECKNIKHDEREREGEEGERAEVMLRIRPSRVGGGGVKAILDPITLNSCACVFMVVGVHADIFRSHC